MAKFLAWTLIMFSVLILIPGGCIVLAFSTMGQHFFALTITAIALQFALIVLGVKKFSG